MEKNKLDKLFQDKFAGREFEFQNKYWEDAEALIEAAEQGKKRRMLGWYFGLLLLITVSFFGLKWMNGEQNNTISEKEEAMMEQMSLDAQNPSITEEEIIKNIESSGPGLPLEGYLLKKKEQINNQKSTVEKTADFNKNLLEKRYNTETESDKNGIDKVTNSTKKEATSQITNNSKSNSYDKNKNANSNLKNAKNAEEAIILNDKNKTTKSNKADKTKKPVEAAVTQPIAEKNAAIEEALIPKTISEVTRKAVTKLNSLTNEFALLNWTPELQRSLKNIDVDEDKYPLKSHRWQLQVVAGLSTLPNPKTNDKRLTNIFGGALLGYKITPNLLIESGLTYQVAQVNKISSEASRQISYGFGKQDDLVALETDQLHFLELPVMVGYQVQKMRFSAGIKTGKLLAARGKTVNAESKFPFERTEDESANFTTKLIQARDNGEEKPVFRKETDGESGWLATDNLKAWQFSLVGKYQFQVSPKFDLGIGLEYRMNSDYLKNGESNHAPLSVQFFTSYRIFN